MERKKTHQPLVGIQGLWFFPTISDMVLNNYSDNIIIDHIDRNNVNINVWI